MIKGCERAGMWQTALSLASRMPAAGFMPDRLPDGTNGENRGMGGMGV